MNIKSFFCKIFNLKNILPILVFTVFGYYLMGTNFHAKLGIIDDHEIAWLLEQDGKISLPQFIPALMKTEVGQWGTFLRYRPSYYMLRVIETSLWHDNATLWYLTRYFMFVGSMLLGYLILSKYVPQLVSLGIILYIFTMPFWPDLLTRLGPSEIYAVPAILAFAYGALTDNFWLGALGYAVCVGAKENFLILLPFLWAWGISLQKKRMLGKKQIVVMGLLTIYSLFIGVGILVATAKTGTDMYGTQISYRYRVTKFVWDIPKIIQDRHVLPALLVMTIPIYLVIREGIRNGWKKMFKSRAVKIMLFMVATVMVIASQYIFYINQLPSNMRYDFPALLLFPVLDISAVLLLLELTKKQKYASLIKTLVYTGMLLICSVFIVRRGYGLIREQALVNVRRTVTFDNQLKSATAGISTPNAPIIFVSNNYGDFEPVVSVARYLTAKGVTNIFMLDYIKSPTNQEQNELSDRFLSVMKGNLGNDKIFERFSKYEVTTPCYSINFGSAPSLSSCQEIARF